MQVTEEKIALAQSRGQKKKAARLNIKAKNIRKDNTCKNSLEIVRKAQFIYMGDLKVPVVTKRKNVKLTQEEIDKRNKKARSENKRQRGIEKRKAREKAAVKESKNTAKINSVNNNKVKNGSNSNKKTKNKKGFGKSLLDQGLGMTQQRLSFICQKTERSFNMVNERYTTQVCSNCRN